jgi:hypothetical protein
VDAITRGGMKTIRFCGPAPSQLTSEGQKKTMTGHAGAF